MSLTSDTSDASEAVRWTSASADRTTEDAKITPKTAEVRRRRRPVVVVVLMVLNGKATENFDEGPSADRGSAGSHFPIFRMKDGHFVE